MKKTLIALAAVASTAAFAQSSVSITGTFGAAYQSSTTAAKAAVAAVAPNVPGTAGYDATKASTLGSAAVAATSAVTNKGFTMSDSTISVAVVEDLGGGLKAAANVNLSGNASRGGNVTKEDSAVSLSGGFGTVAVANTRSSNTAIGALVFASSMPVTSMYAGVDSRAAGDAFSYTSPELAPGLRAAVTVFEATEGSVTSAVKANIVGVTYAAGPLAARVDFKSFSGTLPAGTEKTRTEGFVTYDLGVAKVGVGFGTKRTSTDDNLTAIGVSAPLGAINVGFNYAKRGAAKFTEAGLKYSLSKRTTANVMFGKLTGGASAGNQYRVGVVHTF